MFNKDWYRIEISPEDRPVIEQTLEEGSKGGSTYFVLLFLSTVIATFGLLANSTATVIGAMLIAPLMGPILGLGYALACGDPKGISRSLWTELLGVLTCLGTAASIAVLVRPDHIDFAVAEIVARTHPTLYDLAVGLAAGLGGAYCSVHPRISASIAWVAISVALVPPLAVVGISMIGAVHGDVHWGSPANAFILFLTNFLTIELAAAAVFVLAGMRGEEEAQVGLAGAVALQLVLLAITGIFLFRQLHGLVLERTLKSVATNVISTELKRLPGSHIQRIDLELTSGVSASFIISITSREDIGPKLVASYQKTLTGKVAPYLGKGETVSLVVQTIRSSYASATSNLYVPSNPKKSARQVEYQQLETAMQKTLLKYPGVELDSIDFHGEQELRVLATVTSPYRFDRYLASEVESQVQDYLKAQGSNHTVSLSLRVLQEQVVDSKGDVPYTPPQAGAQEKELLAQRATCKTMTQKFVGHLLGYRFLDCHVSQAPASDKDLIVRLSIEGPRRLDASLTQRWERELALVLSTAKVKREVSLQVDWQMGSLVRPDGSSDSNWRAVESELEKLVAEKGGWLLNPAQGQLVGETLSVTCQIAIPELPSEDLVKAWSKRLEPTAGRSVRLEIQGVLGKGVLEARPSAKSTPHG